MNVNSPAFTPAAASAPPVPAPTEVSEAREAPSAPTAFVDASMPHFPQGTGVSTRPCRNIIIYGFCKYEGKGCAFNHTPVDGAKSTSVTSYSAIKDAEDRLSPAPTSTLRVSSPAFTPRHTTTLADFTTLPVEPEENPPPPHVPAAAGYPARPMSTVATRFTQEMGGETTSYAEHETTPPLPLDNHLYSTPLHPDVAPGNRNVLPHHKAIQTFFLPENLRIALADRSRAMTETHTPQDESIAVAAAAAAAAADPTGATPVPAPPPSGLPVEVGDYHTIREEVEDPHERLIGLTGLTSRVYTGISRFDGIPYTLRRLVSPTAISPSMLHFSEAWQRVRHANVVSLHEVFTTQAFGDTSVILVYTYEPLARSLLDTHFGPGGDEGPVPEATLWTYMTQLLSALKAIHGAGLAARVYDASNVLLLHPREGKRLKISCCCLLDVLPGDPSKTLQHLQHEDMLHFGQLLLSLACHSMTAIHSLPRSLERLSTGYSADCKNVILYLLSKPSPLKNLEDVLAMMGPRLLYELDAAQYAIAGLENELMRELESSRMVRLLTKLGFVNERPEFENDPRWSETGDRYLLKLFRDQLFHQVDPHGRPLLDMAHVLRSLNKLDAGVAERVLLLSRDERSCLVVTYRELKMCLETAYQELLGASQSALA